MDLKNVRALCAVLRELAAARIVKPALERRTWRAVGRQRPATLAARTVARLVRQILAG